MRTFTAIRFREPTKRGLTRPFIIDGIDSDKNKAVIVLKPNAGYEDQGELDHRDQEAFTLLLARALKLEAVEPVSVDIPVDFDFGAKDFESYANENGVVADYPELIQRSIGTNLGTIHLGADWKAWNQTSKPQKLSSLSVNDAFCFDALAQNDDRKADNPNLLWKNDQLMLLDFDRAWCHGFNLQEGKPWRQSLHKLALHQHVLKPHLHLPTEAEKHLESSLAEVIEAEAFPELIQALTTQVTTSFPDSNLDFQPLINYLSALASEPKDLLAYLTQILRT